VFQTETISMTRRRWGDQEMRSQRRAGVPPVEATGVGMREIRM
jgi:hypothetical protein